MKLKGIDIYDHPVLGSVNLSFLDKEEKILNTIVLAGSNGSGKTNLLNAIYNLFYINNQINDYNQKQFGKNVYIEKKINEINAFENNQTNIIITLNSYSHYLENKDDSFSQVAQDLKKKNYLPKIIYIPTEINFSSLTTKTNTLNLEYQFLNKIDKNSIDNIPSYIATRINMLANIEEDMTMKQIKEKVANEINSIFEILELDTKFVGLSKDERSLPMFKNKNDMEFDINKLSSGEKQLFLRALTIKMLKADNSIILIDEPEISLHPKWQQRILKVYENIGINNQIIVATHSPHIIASTHSKNLRLMNRTKEGIEIISGEDRNEIYGKPVDRALIDIMELDSLRTPEIEMKLNFVRELVDQDKYDTEEFKKKYSELETLLGSIDSDLMLIRLDIKRRQRG